jgi:chemotaxis protein histidine kinase CheA
METVGVNSNISNNKRTKTQPTLALPMGSKQEEDEIPEKPPLPMTTSAPKHPQTRTFESPRNEKPTFSKEKISAISLRLHSTAIKSPRKASRNAVESNQPVRMSLVSTDKKSNSQRQNSKRNINLVQAQELVGANLSQHAGNIKVVLAKLKALKNLQDELTVHQNRHEELKHSHQNKLHNQELHLQEQLQIRTKELNQAKSQYAALKDNQDKFK